MWHTWHVARFALLPRLGGLFFCFQPVEVCLVCFVKSEVAREPAPRLYYPLYYPLLDTTPDGVWPNLSPSRDFARRNTAHAWTDGPPPATFTVP